MHSFRFEQNSDVASGVTCELDGRPLYCQSFTLDAKTHDITMLTVTIALNQADINIDGKVLTIRKLKQAENQLADTVIEFK